MSDVIEIVVIDDHPVFRSGLVQLLELDQQFRVVAEGGSGTEAIRLAERHKPDIMTLDLSMGESGLEAIAPVRKASPSTKIVVLTASDAAFDVQTSLERGIDGYLLKGAPGAEILEAINIVSSGQKYVSARAMSRALTAAQAQEIPTNTGMGELSIRELTVLELVAKGQSNREIGDKLGVEEKSVKFHLTNIFSKLGVRNRVEATISFTSSQKG